MAACRIQVYSYQVHTAFYRLVERLFQFILVYVVLVLSHTDRLRIDLHQFRKRIHQAASDRNRAAHRDIVVGKFVARRFRCRINGGSLFAHCEYRNLAVEFLPDTEKGIARIAVFPCFAYGRVGVDVLVMQKIALLIQANRLAAGAETGVDG